ncbi:MAG: hypothetical protein OEZ36_08255 [Spirochaetota bacterium]|nr:hypothetical protein [Spirochaetota bacterium]
MKETACNTNFLNHWFDVISNKGHNIPKESSQSIEIKIQKKGSSALFNRLINKDKQIKKILKKKPTEKDQELQDKQIKKILKKKLSEKEIAIHLQLAAERKKNKVLRVFQIVMEHYAFYSNIHEAPSLPVIVAVSYVRNFDIPKEQIDKIVGLLLEVGKKGLELDFENKDKFIYGILYSFETMGYIDKTVELILNFINYHDVDIINQSLSCLYETWKRTVSEKINVAIQYKDLICNKLNIAITEYLNKSKSRETLIPGYLRAISLSMDLYLEINKNEFDKYLPLILRRSFELEDGYLEAAVTEILTKLALNERKRLIETLENKLLKEFPEKWNNFKNNYAN